MTQIEHYFTSLFFSLIQTLGSRYDYLYCLIKYATAFTEVRRFQEEDCGRAQFSSHYHMQKSMCFPYIIAMV